jgi:hypothetical protein
MGLGDVRHGFRLLRAGGDATRRDVVETRRDLGHYGAQIGAVVTAGEAQRDARGDAAAAGQLPVLLLCGEALAEAFVDATLGCSQVVVPVVDEAFFASAAEAAARDESTRPPRRDERRDRDRDRPERRERRDALPPMASEEGADEAEEEAVPEEGADSSQAPARPVEQAATPAHAPEEPRRESKDEADLDPDGDDDGDEADEEGEEAAEAVASEAAPVEVGADGRPAAEGRRKRRRRRRRGGRGRGDRREGGQPEALNGAPVESSTGQAIGAGGGGGAAPAPATQGGGGSDPGTGGA